MNIEVDTVKGFRDFLPPESLKKVAVQKVIERYFQLYGFVPIETPVIEFDELMKPETLSGEQEDEAVSERFRLLDRAGRKLGLRYEFTFQLARIFRQNPNIKLPFKRYQIGQLFRDEPIGPGRYRQFTQCDADIIGDESVRGEAECLALVQDILNALKIKNTEIQVGNRKLLQAIIESAEIIAVKEIMRELDKLDKIGEDMVKANLRKYADANQVLTLFKLLEKGLPFFQENAFDGTKELMELQQACKPYGVAIKFNPFLVRGLGYYTSSIFEVKEPGKPSIAAGGRYDKVVGKHLHREIPAVGISFGLERISELAQIVVEQLPYALVISIEQPNAAVMLAKKLRKVGVSTSLSFDKVGKALEYANSLQIPIAIFVGEDEVKKKKFKIRHLNSGKEEMLTEKQLVQRIGK